MVMKFWFYIAAIKSKSLGVEPNLGEPHWMIPDAEHAEDDWFGE